MEAKADTGMAAMPEGFLVKVAHRFKVLGEPGRLRLVQCLMEGEKSVGTLVKEAGLNQANASRHLHSLVEAGLLARRKEGNFVFYSIRDPSVYELCDLVCRSLRERHREEAGLFGSAGPGGKAEGAK
jgi:ArsR family transcriptional regulator